MKKLGNATIFCLLITIPVGAVWTFFIQVPDPFFHGRPVSLGVLLIMNALLLILGAFFGFAISKAAKELWIFSGDLYKDLRRRKKA